MLLKRKARRGTAQSTAGAAPAGVGEALARSATAPVSGAATPASAAAGASATMEEVQARIAAAKAEAKAEFEAELAKAKAEADKRAADAEKRAADADKRAADADKRAADAEKRAEADRAAKAELAKAKAEVDMRAADAKKAAEATGGTTDPVGVVLRSHALRQTLTPNIFPSDEQKRLKLTVSQTTHTAAMLLVRNDKDKDFPLRVEIWQDADFANHLRFGHLGDEQRALAENLLDLVDARPTGTKLWGSVKVDSDVITPLYETDYEALLFAQVWEPLMEFMKVETEPTVEYSIAVNQARVRGVDASIPHDADKYVHLMQTVRKGEESAAVELGLTAVEVKPDFKHPCLLKGGSAPSANELRARGFVPYRPGATKFTYVGSLADFVNSNEYLEFERDEHCSVRQVFTYMLAHRTRYGIFTTLDRWTFFKLEPPPEIEEERKSEPPSDTKKKWVLRAAGPFHAVGEIAPSAAGASAAGASAAAASTAGSSSVRRSGRFRTPSDKAPMPTLPPPHRISPLCHDGPLQHVVPGVGFTLWQILERFILGTLDRTLPDPPAQALQEMTKSSSSTSSGRQDKGGRGGTGPGASHGPRSGGLGGGASPSKSGLGGAPHGRSVTALSDPPVDNALATFEPEAGRWLVPSLGVLNYSDLWDQRISPLSLTPEERQMHWLPGDPKEHWVGRTGNVYRQTMNGCDLVLKVVSEDIKEPEGMYPLDREDLNNPDTLIAEMRKEARVYDRLRELQGAEIPRLLFEGPMLQWYFHGLATSYAGRCVQEVDPKELTSDFASEALAALDKVHALGVVHGDVALRNLLVGEDGHPVIIDFGMALVVGEDVDEEEAHWRMKEERDKLEQELRALLVVRSSSPTDGQAAKLHGSDAGSAEIGVKRRYAESSLNEQTV